MITAFRSHLNSWFVRALFLVLVAAFALWGIGDVRRLSGPDTWVAKVGSATIEAPQLDEAFKRELAQVAQRLGKTEPTPQVRLSVAAQVLDRMIAQNLLAQEAARLHIAVPTDALVQSVYQIRAFQGPGGQFDRAKFEQVLRNNGMNEPRFLELLRGDLAQRQLVEAVRAGTVAPAQLVKAVFAFQGERRSADYVAVSLADAKPVAAPDDAVLRRWWENHPAAYRTPEYRKIKAVVLSPQTLAKDIQLSDADVQAAYDAHKGDYVTPPKRTAEVVTGGDEAKAAALAAAWRGGADWATVQRDAQAAGGSAVELTDAAEAEFPSPELGRAVFAAAPDSVVGPVQGPFGWYVLRVGRVTPGSERSFAEVKDQIRDRLLAEKAADLMYDRANKIDNLLGNGTALDALPGDLGLGAVTGTLDAAGNTTTGEPAPIPGSPELRAAVAAAAFAAQKNDPPRLTEVPGPAGGSSAYYALQVEDIVPAAVRPFDAVREQVATDWTRDAERKEQEAVAARLLAAVKGGETLEAAATATGLHVRRTPPTARTAPAEGFPPALLGPAFALKAGEPTMVETADGFLVAMPAEIVQAEPGANALAYGQVRDALSQALAGDVELSFLRGLRDRAQPRINQGLLEQIAQP